MLCRDRQQRRSAAREREAESEAQLRELQALQIQVQDRMRSVESYQQAGKAERLQEVRESLQRFAVQLQDQEAKLKVCSSQLLTSTQRTRQQPV